MKAIDIDDLGLVSGGASTKVKRTIICPECKGTIYRMCDPSITSLTTTCNICCNEIEVTL